MKKVLILVLSGDFPPYNKMVETSGATWDRIVEPGAETVYYFANHKQSKPPFILYPSVGLNLPIEETIFNIGLKTILAFEWAIENKIYHFDYIARVNSSTYVNKKELVKYIQTLPEENLYEGLVVRTGGHHNFPWCWGPSFILSKDVVKKLCGKKDSLNPKLMEDVALSALATELNIPFTDGRACTIDFINEHKWRCQCYRSDSYEFSDFSEIKKDNGQFFFRCKQDNDRSQDEYVMRELFKHLNS